MTTHFDYIWKIIVGGAGGVGKTSMLHRYFFHEFVEDMKMTIGVQFHDQQLERQGRHISMVMWDLGGQERFRFVQPAYIRGAVAAFLLFDLTDPITLDNIQEEWIPIIRDNAESTVPILLVGTKVDLVDEITLFEMTTQAQGIVDANGLAGFVATSSKLNINVNETILYMVDLLLWQAFGDEYGTGLRR
jgi:small GTP-binding protein